MNNNGYNNFSGANSFNGMSNNQNFDPQYNNMTLMNNQSQFNNMMNNPGMEMNNPNMNGGSRFFNETPASAEQPDMMVGPNPFDLIRSYEEAGNQENAMNASVAASAITQPVNNVYTNPINNNVAMMQPQQANIPNAGIPTGQVIPGMQSVVNQNVVPISNMNVQPFMQTQPVVQSPIIEQQPVMQPQPQIVGQPVQSTIEQSVPVTNVVEPVVTNMPLGLVNNVQTMVGMPNTIQGSVPVQNIRMPDNTNTINQPQMQAGIPVQGEVNIPENVPIVEQPVIQNEPIIEQVVQEPQVTNELPASTQTQAMENSIPVIEQQINNNTSNVSEVQSSQEQQSVIVDNPVNATEQQMVPEPNNTIPVQEITIPQTGETVNQTVVNELEPSQEIISEQVDMANEPIQQSPETVENMVSSEDSLTQAEEVVEDTPIQVVQEEVTQEPVEVVEDVVPDADMTASFNTDEFEARFGVNYDDAVSKNDAIFKGLKYRITVLSEILIRLEYSDSGTFEDRPTELARFRAFDVPKVMVTDEERMLTLRTSYFELTYEKEKPFTGTKFSPDQYLKIKLLDTDKSWYFGHAEARNFKSTCSNLDGASSIPKLEKGLYSTDGFVSLDDSNSLIFNPDGSVGKRNDKRIDTYLFLYKKDFGFCLKDFYRLTGYPPLIPRYALGVWWNRDEEYDVNGIYALLAKFRKYEIPISVLLLNHWSKNDVTFDREKIPSPDNVINNLHSDDIKIGVDLKLTTVPSTQNGTKVDAPFNVYDRGFMANYFNSFIKPLNALGVDFYSLSYRGNDMAVLRMINYYFYKYLNSEPNKRGMILSRNGLINSHLYPINNSGETIVDWKTLKMLPEFNSTGSNLGISWWSHAIGGFKDGVEESELYTRFVQLGTYSPIFRFSSKGGHYYKREPWRWDVKTRKIVKDYTNLRHKMIPYLYSESYKYSKTGLPLVQPLYYRYPELYDEPTYRNEYYFGTELFIAPITERKDPVMNRTVTKLFLPNGMWYDFKTGKKFPGGKRYISFFQDEDYPVFAKQGAIIPQSIIPDEKRNFTGNPDAMEIHIFPGKNNTYKLYEDDGSSNAYKNGEFMTTSIDYNYLPNNYTVIIRPLEGKEGIVPAKRSYKIRFRNTRFADDVIAYLGSERIQVKMVLDDQDFIVETEPVSTKEQLSINCKGKNIEIDAVRIINDDIDTIISDLKIPTRLKEEVARIMFSEEDIKKKRIEIRKLSSQGLNDIFVKMFLKLLEYIGEF